MNLTLSVLAAVWTAFQIDPFYTEPHPRDAAPKDGRETTELTACAAIGEIEAVSFMLCPARALEKLDVVPSDLKGPSGAVIPGDAVDVRTVKYWWQDRIRWTSYYNWEKYAKKNAITPDILLHDDSLIRVDEEGTNNYIRVDYPTGSRYVCVSKDIKGDFNDDLEPLRDAKKFVPFDLKAGRYHQFWLTLRVPADARPGKYEGTIALVENGNAAGELKLKLEVYPFALPTPRTRIDPERDYHAWIMCHDSLGWHLSQGKNLAAAEAKVLNIYRNLAEHNCHPGGPGEIKADSPDDPGIRGLALMQKAGLCLKPVFAGGGCDWTWMSFQNDQAEKGVTVTPESHPKEFAESIARFNKTLDRDEALYRKYTGHADLIYTAQDEGSTALNRRQFPFWNELHKRGMRVFATAGDPAGAGHQIDMNDILSTISVKVSSQWHVAGGTAYSYAAQFFGAIQPDHYRRDKGIRFWSVNYDGANEYVWYEGMRWNDFIENSDNYGTFGIVFPVQDGVLDTCAWEAYREGVDDIRYLSLLNLRATEAMASPDKALAQKGRAELAWLMSVDSEKDIDLDALRREVARRIQTLPPSRGETRKPFVSPKIELPPASEGVVVADDKALEECNRWIGLNRYDMALKYARQALDREGITQEARDTVIAKIVWLHIALRDRESALKLLKEAEEYPPVTAAHRAKMQLEQAAVLLTACNYAEVVPTANVDRAAELLELTRSVPGFNARKQEMFIKVIGAYQNSGIFDKVLAMTEEPVKDKATKAAELQAYRALRVRAAGGLGDYKLLVKEFNAFEKLDHGAPQRKSLLQFVGDAAAKQNDAKIAARAYSELYAYYDPKDEGQKHERGHVERAMQRWVSEARKTQSFDGDAEEDIISLDED